MYLTKDSFNAETARCLFCHEHMSRIMDNTRKTSYFVGGKIRVTYEVARRKECTICRGTAVARREIAVRSGEYKPELVTAFGSPGK
ncbi:MAG: hypothetical protein AABZ39_13075 [Spirochaetota bacterium]